MLREQCCKSAHIAGGGIVMCLSDRTSPEDLVLVMGAGKRFSK